MDLSRLEKISDYEWRICPYDRMQVPAIIFGSTELIQGMDDKVFEQLRNVASLPGIVRAAYAMPDAHWGYGFPIGGVAAFDPDNNGVISAGGVGFDISCGVRLLTSGLEHTAIEKQNEALADALFKHIPAGVGSRSQLNLNATEIDAVLTQGARWAVANGYGFAEDLERIEEHGQMFGASPEEVSPRAKERQRPEMGTLGSGNHYLEVQKVHEIYDSVTANAFGLKLNEVVISIHCGSRGLGHQIGTDFLKEMAIADKLQNFPLLDRELAYAPIRSQIGSSYIGAMRSATNCALANRQILTHFARKVFNSIFPKSHLSLVYDVSHNTCKEEWHNVNGEKKLLFVHRKGATRALGPYHPQLPISLREYGQPVFIGGSMGVGSLVLAGLSSSEEKSFSSACHGAGRAMSRTQAMHQWEGQKLMRELRQQGVIIRSPSFRGIAEEAPGAYKDVHAVAEATEKAGLAKKVAWLSPMICIKG